MKTSPHVSVLMPVYNAEAYLSGALESILNQTFEDYELLMIDDGSVDGSLEIMKSYRDPRIRILCNERNLGIIQTLNRGLGECLGAFIARMDADDRSEPERLEKQVGVFKLDEELALCGTAYCYIDSPNETLGRYPDPDHVRMALLFENPFHHSSVMMRRTEFLQYPDAFPHAEDYGLWVELSRHSRLQILQKPLLKVRRHEGQVSHRCSVQQAESMRRIQEALLEELGVKRDAIDTKMQSNLGAGCVPVFGCRRRLKKWSERLQMANKESQWFGDVPFREELERRQLDALDRIGTMSARLPWYKWLYWRTSITFTR